MKFIKKPIFQIVLLLILFVSFIIGIIIKEDILTKSPPQITQEEQVLQEETAQNALNQETFYSSHDNSENFLLLIKKIQPRLDPMIAKEIVANIKKYAEKFYFPEELIFCIIARESTFDPLAVSSANCVGLMQISRKAHPQKIKSLNISQEEVFYIDHNIHLGCMILREYYNSTKQISEALERYVGKNNEKYKTDILSSFVDILIKNNNKQFPVIKE